METKTIIYSNGSKTLGEKPDTLEKLYEVLSKNTLEDFSSIEKLENGFVRFLGNFEEISHVFNIDSSDPKVIANLTSAIVLNKIKNKRQNHFLSTI